MRTRRATPEGAARRAPSATALSSWCCRSSSLACVLGLLVLGLPGPMNLGQGKSTTTVTFDGHIDLTRRAVQAPAPESRDLKPGWMEYHERLKAQAESEGAGARVLMLGDSITEELLGTSLGEPREDRGDTLSVWLEYYNYLGAINLGVSGDQTQHLLWRLQNGELPDVLQPEAIVVAIGTNNLGNGMSVRETVEGIRVNVEYLRKERPDALVYVMALFPRADREDKTSPRPWPVIDQVNASMLSMLNREFGDKMVAFMDCTARFLAEDETGSPVLNGAFILPDNLHLTREGLQAWAECVEADLHASLSGGAG